MAYNSIALDVPVSMPKCSSGLGALFALDKGGANGAGKCRHFENA